MKQILAVLALASSTAASQTLINPAYNEGHNTLFAQNYTSFNGTVPTGKQLNVTRLDAYAVTLDDNSMFKVDDAYIIANGVARSTVYGSIYGMENHGSGLVNGDYRRLSCQDVGPCIAHKTAVRGNPASGYGMWLYQDQVGPNVQAVRWITADYPALYGNTSYAIPRIDLIGGDLDITGAVVQWNVSAKTTGDYLHILRPDGTLAFRITKDGVILINEVPLDAYIDARINAALKTHLEAARYQAARP